MTTPPKQYTDGWTEFYKLRFNLTRDVLIPRPETELLVDEVLSLKPDTVLDIGTGSGCIAISIAKNLPKAKLFATDISPEALKVAKENAQMHKTLDQIIFFEADLLPNFKIAPDVIVTNLPYIPSARLKLIDPMVTEFEPKIALDGSYDGFELYRTLFDQLKQRGVYPKYLVAEIDYTQAEFAPVEVKKRFPNAKTQIKKDLAKKDRILIINFSN